MGISQSTLTHDDAISLTSTYAGFAESREVSRAFLEKKSVPSAASPAAVFAPGGAGAPAGRVEVELSDLIKK
jgi:hypothetical protein